MSTALVSARKVALRYGGVRALDGVDLDLAPGRIVGLLGPNGCGKTTLMKILAGVLQGYDGRVSIAGHEPGPESKALVSYLPDSGSLPGGSAVEACVEMFRDFFADFDEAKARQMLGHFNLDTTMRLRQMSKGMREKVHIALALSRRARVHVLDEPISGVDPAARQVIMGGILRSFDDDSLMLLPPLQYAFAASIGREKWMNRPGAVGPVIVYLVLSAALQVLSFVGLAAVPLGIGMTDGSPGLVSWHVFAEMAAGENAADDVMPIGFIPVFLVVALACIWCTARSWDRKIALA